MNTNKILKQALMRLGINTNDLDVNKNTYYKMATEELENMREQILGHFKFQIKIAKLSKLPEEDYEPIFINDMYLYAYNKPSDFMSIKPNGSVDNEYIRIFGDIIFMPQNLSKLEYYSSGVRYEDFPSYTENYVLYELCARMSAYLSRPSNEFMQLVEYEKQKINSFERNGSGFSYLSSNLVRR